MKLYGTEGSGFLCLEVMSIQFQANRMLKAVTPAVEHTVSFVPNGTAFVSFYFQFFLQLGPSCCNFPCDKSSATRLALT